MPNTLMPNPLMQNKSTKQPVIRTLILASLLMPILHFSQGLVYAAQPLADEAKVSDVKLEKSASSAEYSSAAKQRLMTKLGKLAFFSANFSQKILNEQGKLLQQGTGKLAISKPNLVYWQTVTPDETLIVSDGNTLWFYDPFIEQASAYSLAKSIHNTPILLLISDDATLWQQYTVVQERTVALAQDADPQTNKPLVERFIVTPKDKNSQIKRLTISFTVVDSAGEKTEQLSEFSFQDATGQISQISLSQFNSTDKPEASLFSFSLPQGVRLEDQR
ncbi:outer membrane lipoprotein chaperone LolA [Colwellia sp. MT41]|uniref:outer membrane lipoprotein chaperone LolA n=1 Tax=Colwellia sp. MT41 TaxID=58049 RepID=UPI000AF040EF|nr:outer membrane lipoprotein chaperone LolA [Colwellia sp. MT41]